MQPDQIINFLTIEELLDVVPKQALWPRVFLIKPSQTLFLAGLGRIDYVSGAEKIRLAVFASHKLPILIVKTEDAETVYNDCLGSELLKVPRGGPERYAQFPKLKRSEEAIKVTGYDAEHKSECGKYKYNAPVLTIEGEKDIIWYVLFAFHRYSSFVNGLGISESATIRNS